MLAFLLILQLALSPQEAEPRATLCLDDECSSREPADLTIAPADHGRRFILISPDSAQIVAGTVPAGESALRLDNDNSTHKFAVRFSGATVPVTFELSDRERMWTWTMAAPRGRMVIRHPQASRLTVRAAEHKPVERILAPSVVDLGVIDLQRFPLITGTVVDAKTSAPIPDAEIFLDSGKRVAVTDRGGHFRAVVSDPWPRTISIASAARATRIVPVPKLVADTDLSLIPLQMGGAIHLVVQGAQPRRWQLRARVTEFTDELRREGSLEPGQTEWTIAGVDAGRYHVVVQGGEPLEQFSTAIDVQEGQRSDASVEIQPVTVKLQTRLGANALDRADLHLRHLSALWTAKITTDDAGVFETPLWQPGELEAIMSRMPSVHSWKDRREIDDGTDWTIRAVDRRIRGRVLDAQTGAPVEGASVVLTMHDADGQSLFMRTAAAADGTFEFGAVVAGGHTVQAAKAGYQPDQTWSIAVGEGDELVEKNLPLEPYAAQVRVVAMSSAAIPISDAVVFFASRAGVREIAATDASGRATIPLTFAEETGVAFVVPRSGSLGFARVANNEDELVVRVPAGSARVEVRAESMSGEPVSRVGLMMRWNGMFLPHQVVSALAAATLTDAAGRIVYPSLPPGQYDLWPFASQEEFRRVYYEAPPAPAATVQVIAGQQTVVLKFSGS